MTDIHPVAAVLAASVESGVVGISAAILAPDGVRREFACGSADLGAGTPLTPRHRFRIASITKTFVFALVLQLHEEGKLDIEAPLRRWLPALPHSDRVTLRHVLTQTGGLPTYSHDALDEFPPADSLWTPEALVALAYRKTPPRPPGGGMVYANVGSKVAALVAGMAGDEPLPEAIRRRFLAPLGLDTVVPSGAGGPLPADLARGYHFLPDRPEPVEVTRRVPPSFLWGSGDMLADPAALVAWADALYGGRVLPRERTRELLTLAHPGRLAGSTLREHGLGVMFFVRDSIRVAGHRGSTPGYASILAYRPETGTSVAVLANCHAADPDSLHRAGVEDALFRILAACGGYATRRRSAGASTHS